MADDHSEDCPLELVRRRLDEAVHAPGDGIPVWDRGNRQVVRFGALPAAQRPGGQDGTRPRFDGGLAGAVQSRGAALPMPIAYRHGGDEWVR